uniref:Uncharacterized protein n=1 Tax=Romanomermis culicivorax TaxID=13658 RepID=A0A915HZQ0_ROMCU
MLDDGSESLDYDDSPTPTPNLGLGRLASQSPDSRPPTSPRSSCSDNKMEIIPVGEKENRAPRLEAPQVDGNGPNKKPNLAPLLEKYQSPKIKRQPMVPRLEPGSLMPNVATFREEALPKPIWRRLEGQVASWDGNNLINTLGDLGGCKANASHCVMADGVVMWDETPLEKICPFELKNSYKIKITASIFHYLKSSKSIGLINST